MTKKKKYIFLTVLFLGLIIVCSLLVYNRKVTEEKVEEEVSQLYFDEKYDYINPNISFEQFEKAKYDTRQLRGEKRKVLEELVLKAQRKQEAITFLNNCVENKHPLIVGTQVNAEWVLDSDVKMKAVEEKSALFDFDYEDDLVVQLKTAYQKIKEVAKEKEKIDKILKDLPAIFSPTREEEDIEKYAKAYEEVVKQREHLNNVLQNKIFKEHLVDYATSMKNQTADESTESQPLDHLFAHEELADLLTGSPADFRPLVALTFDEGPDEGTEEVLEILKENDVKATFYLQGAQVEKNPDLAKKIVEEGFHVGNNGYDHSPFSKLTDKQIKDQIQKTQEIIEKVTGFKPTSFRTPYGQERERTAKLCAPLKGIYWNNSANDWKEKTEEGIYYRLLSQVKRHTVIRQHASIPMSRQALKRLIPMLKKKGYIFVYPEQIAETADWLKGKSEME